MGLVFVDDRDGPFGFLEFFVQMIGWVCALALAYQYLLKPLAMGILPNFGIAIAPLPGLDDNLWQLMMGMLGMGGLRTFEKVQGVASK